MEWSRFCFDPSKSWWPLLMLMFVKVSMLKRRNQDLLVSSKPIPRHQGLFSLSPNLTEISKGLWRGSSCKGFKEAVATVETLPLRFWGHKSAGGSEHLPDGSFSSHWTGRVREQGGAGCGQAPLFWAGNCCSPSLHSKKLSYRDLKSLAHGHPTTNERIQRRSLSSKSIVLTVGFCWISKQTINA